MFTEHYADALEKGHQPRSTAHSWKVEGLIGLSGFSIISLKKDKFS